MREYKSIFALCFYLPFLLAACSVGSKYTRTNLELPENYGSRIVVTGDTVLLPWRTYFEEPILIRQIEKALEKNSEISNAMMNLDQLELLYKQAGFQQLPVIDLSAGGSRNWPSKNYSTSQTDQSADTRYNVEYNAALKLSWEADVWGKAAMQKEEALANFFAQKENLSALKTRIIVQVAQAYYNLIALDEQLAVARRNVELSDSTLSIIKLQYNAGLENALAVEQAVAQKKTAELLIPTVLQSIVLQENSLSILCGSYPDSLARTGNTVSAMSPEIFPSGVPATLLSKRPDLKAAEFTVVSANAKTGIAKAAMYPSFSLTASAGLNSSLWNKWFNLPGSLFENMAVNLTQPIFQKNALKSTYDVAVIEQQKAASQFKLVVMSAVSEVTDAIVKSKYASERLDLLSQRMTALNRALNNSLLLYKNGKANYLEVITVQNNILQNELEMISTKREKYNAVTDLYRALGGGVE